MVDYEMRGRNETFITLTFTACVCDESEETASKFTLTVSSMVRNFLLSPISMALLIRGTASFTASSMGTGGMFSPPAVMISSKHHTRRTDLVTDQSQRHVFKNTWLLKGEFRLKRKETTPLILPVMKRNPFWSSLPRSPECSQPSESRASSVFSGMLR